jgi:plastocyanin
MLKFVIGTAAIVAAAPTETCNDLAEENKKLRAIIESMTDNSTVEDAPEHGRELFPVYSIGTKCARRGCSIYHQISRVNPMMSSVGDADRSAVKGPVKALEMLALNDDLNTVISSDNMCTRRHAMARAAGLAAGLALSAVNAPAFAAETKMVKMGSDSGQLVFVPDEVKICKGDTVTWTNNKGGPHNVVFDEEAIPDGVDQGAISMDGQLGDEGETFSKKFDTAGTYSYYCEPHRGAGMNAQLIVG